MIKGLTHVAIWVTDIDRSMDFYLRIPGVKEHFRLHKEDGGLWLIYLRIAPYQFVELFPRAQGSYQPPTHAGYSHLCMETDDIHGLYKELVANGVTPDFEPKMGADGSLQIWIHDPDGTPIEFQQFIEGSMHHDK
jgi:lactoylglutathione lyase